MKSLSRLEPAHPSHHTALRESVPINRRLFSQAAVKAPRSGSIKRGRVGYHSPALSLRS